jgi:purine-binding chemotaxis protein CheW
MAEEETTNGGGTEPEATEPEVTEPEATVVEAAEPEAAQPEAAATEAATEAAEPAGDAGGLDELIATLDAEVAAAPLAEAAAPPRAEAAADGRPQRLVIFSLAGARYAVPVGNVVEVGSVPAVTPVPNVPGWIVGVANLRGEILSVIDLGGYLGLEGRPAGGGRLMVVRTAGDGEEWTSSLLVDHVTGMSSVARGEIGSTTAPITDRVSPYLTGVYHRDDGVVSVLDLDRLLAAPELRQFERA